MCTLELHGQNIVTACNKGFFPSLEMQRILSMKELSGNEEDHIQVIQNCKIAIIHKRHYFYC